ncbi:MAG: VanZ family protein [Dorea sp.]
MNYKSKRRFRIIGKILFVLYIAFIIYFLIFSDWYGRTGEMQEYRYNLVLFKEIKRFWEYRDQLGWFAMFTNLFGNVLIFVPFGFFMPMASKYRSFLATAFSSFGLCFCVETFQLVTRVGSFDVDDLLLNTIGGIIGYIVFALCAAMRRYHDNKKKRKKYRRS